jgi:hypothetical protein
VASVAADTTNDIGSEVSLLGAIVFAMANLTTVLASLVLIITEGTVKGGEFTQLITLKLVLAFGNGCSLM